MHSPQVVLNQRLHPTAAMLAILAPTPGRRHAALAQLLAASPAEMRRIISIYPNLLARDPGALRSNTASLTALLGAAEEEVQALLRKEPGLLSYNMSTLATRWSYAMQVGGLKGVRLLCIKGCCG